MKNTILILLTALILMITTTSCAHQQRFETTNNTTIVAQPYGVFDENDSKMDGVKYKVSMGNVIWACILIETIFVPVIIVGWYLYEPVSLECK